MQWVMHHMEWVFSGIGVSICSLVGRFIWRRFVRRAVLPLEARKQRVHVMMIDGEDNPMLFQVIIKAGWVHATLRKDVYNLDAPEVLDAHIILVNARGVGALLFRDAGVGLAGALKERYPGKKIVLYSIGPGELFPRTLRVDAYLPPNEQPYELIRLLDDLSAELENI